jgi:hypothetical protein
MWEIAMSPEEYGRRFNTVLATVELACHTTGVPTTRNGHEPEFKRWILLGKQNHQLWVHPDVKGPFFDEICKHIVVFESTSELIATYGSPMVPVREFVRCLVKARCQTIWIKAYGQKLSIGSGPLLEEPAEPAHPKANHNQWDLGTTFKSRELWLWGNAKTNKSLTTYPMVIPSSLDLGSVMGTITYQDNDYGFKVYPRLVHTIKAFRSKLQGDIPKTLRGVQVKARAGLQVIHLLGTVDPLEIGGFRIELTVGARTLADARAKVQSTPLLDPKFWLDPPEPHGAYKLTVTHVTKDGLLANADWVYRQHTLADPFHGTGNSRPTKRQVQIMSDVLAGFGWNAGKRRPTKSLAADAWWWIDRTVETMHGVRLSLLADLQAKYTSAPAKVRLIHHVRQHHSNYLPCQLYPADPKHRYNVVNQSPFRLRCPKCKSHLTSAAAMQWIAQLLMDGRVPLVAAGLDPPVDFDDSRRWERGESRPDT